MSTVHNTKFQIRSLQPSFFSASSRSPTALSSQIDPTPSFQTWSPRKVVSALEFLQNLVSRARCPFFSLLTPKNIKDIFAA